MSNKLQTKRVSKRIVATVFLLIIIVMALVLEISNSTHLFRDEKVPAVIKSQKGSESSNKQYGSSQGESEKDKNNSDSRSSEKVATATGGAKGELAVPYGDFISNHHPGRGTPTRIVSICYTTPGASCYIKLSNGQTTTQLPNQTTNNDGFTRWDWDVNTDARLTSGSWQVTAVAALNGQTKSTTDQINLEIR